MITEQDRSIQTLAGEGGKLNEYANQRWREHLVQLTPVRNTVLWVNPAFEGLPFSLEEGKPSDLGLYADHSFKKKPSTIRDGKVLGEAWADHGRSIILGRYSITDKDGYEYRDVDLKGVGHFKPTYYPSKGVSMELRDIGWQTEFDWNWTGLFHKDIAEYDRDMNEKMLSAGVRTPRCVAIVELKELISKETRCSIDELKNKRGITKDVRPVIEIRAFRTRARLHDLELASRDRISDIAGLLIDDAVKLASQEQLGTKIMSYDEYLAWFGKTMGKNIGLMHQNDWYHRYLTPHNLTLDSRVVDFDSLDENANQEQKNDDLDKIDYSLTIFANNFAKATISKPEAALNDPIHNAKLLMNGFTSGYCFDKLSQDYIANRFKQRLGYATRR